MNEQATKADEYVEIDFQRVIAALIHKSWIVILVAVLSAIITFLAVFFLGKPLYQSSAMFYVNNNSLSLGEASFSIESGDITAAKSLVDSYIVILTSRQCLTQVIDEAQVDRSYSEVKGMISAEAVNETQIFRVVVTSETPEEAKQITEAIEKVLPKEIEKIIVGSTPAIVDTAVENRNQTSPNYTKSTFLGFMIGLAIAAVFVILQEVFDITIRSEEDVEQVCKHPMLASVPDMGAPSKGSYYYYGYGSKRRGSKKKTAANSKNDAPVLFGGDISFAAAEAYKLLRTKLQFSFVDEGASKVIGFSSALSGEGKSLTAVNLAYTLSQLNKKVLLIDCDMRRPTLADKLGIKKQPGLSGYLTGQHKLEGLMQMCNLKNDEEAFDVIAAGQNPPNPIELLSSEKMTSFLAECRKTYDYIILDLPPVGEVSDALAVAKETDGMLLVVRQNYCDRLVLKDTARQFEFINAKILGVVYNCTTESSTRYGKGYYKKYYRRYYRRYYSRSSRRYEGAYMVKKSTQGNENNKV